MPQRVIFAKVFVRGRELLYASKIQYIFLYPFMLFPLIMPLIFTLNHSCACVVVAYICDYNLVMPVKLDIFHTSLNLV